MPVFPLSPCLTPSHLSKFACSISLSLVVIALEQFNRRRRLSRACRRVATNPNKRVHARSCPRTHARNGHRHMFRPHRLPPDCSRPVLRARVSAPLSESSIPTSPRRPPAPGSPAGARPWPQRLPPGPARVRVFRLATLRRAPAALRNYDTELACSLLFVKYSFWNFREICARARLRRAPARALSFG